jgi:phosphotransferase system  glucose/maltose/N-acetylglucosamine-specific IIC component
MVGVFRKVYSVLGAVILALYVLQLYFIAGAIFTIVEADDNQKSIYSAFKNADNSFLGLHSGNGDLIGILIILLLIVSFAARLPRRTNALSGALFVLIIIQNILAHTGIAALSALHGINALLLIGLTGYLTSQNWAFGRRAAPAA